MEKRKRRSSLVGPLILIGLGVVFLLNNVGLLDWSIWGTILRLWPVLIIAIGLDLLLGRRSVWGGLLALVLIVAVLVGGLWLLSADIGAGRAATSEKIVQALGEATRAEVSLAAGAGTLRVEALPESANLVEGEIQLGQREKVTRDFAIEGSTATFTLQSEGETVGPFFGQWDEGRSWELGLAPQTPLKLKVNLGAGELALDLTGLKVTELDASMGVGKATVTLPAEGRFQAKISGAIGETIVVIPEGLEARVRINTAIGSRQLPEDYRRQDNIYTSPGYERADNRVDLEVGLAIGSVTVRRAGR